MSTPPPSEIAQREARRMAAVLREIGGDGAPVGSGWMACDQPGSWADYAAGLGVAGPVDGPTLDRLVAFYRERNRRPSVQIAPYEHSTLWEGLAERSFSVRQRESVLVRALTGLPSEEPVPGLAFRPVDPSSDHDVAAFGASQMAGFFTGDPPAGMPPITERVARFPRARLWLLEMGGRGVGSGGLEIFEESAVLIAGCVHAHARRQGLHSAFIRFRLRQAAQEGARYAIVASTPGGPTERNALRAGFSPAYTQLRLQQGGRGPR